MTWKENQFYKFYKKNQWIFKIHDVVWKEGSPYYLKQEDLESYQIIIDKVVKLLKELNFINPVMIQTGFEYLLWNGYLSYGKKYQFCKTKDNNFINGFGLSIMQGKGNCSNHADMFDRILNEMEYDHHLILSILPKKDKSIMYRPAITRNVSKSSIHLTYVEKLMVKTLGNHMFNLVKYSGKYYICDTTNLLTFCIDEFLCASALCSKMKSKLRLWPLAVFEGLGIEDIVSICQNYQQPSILNDAFVIENAENSMEICQNNKGLLDDFYFDIYPEIKEVCKVLKRNN